MTVSETAAVTVAKKTLTITADAKTKVEGEEDPALTYTAEGLVGSDGLTGSLERESGETPGTYAIRQGTLAASQNYDLVFKGEELTITAKPVVPADPDYVLLASMKSAGSTSLKIRWTKAPDADGYDIFFKICDGKGHYPRRKTIKGRGKTSYTIRGLKKNRAYKAYVRAWKRKNGKKTYIGKRSPIVHAITGGYTSTAANPGKVTVQTADVTLAAGENSRIRANVKTVNSGMDVLSHGTLLRYYSSDRNVATVSSAGRIRAVGAGTCTIYVVSGNGVRIGVRVKVTKMP